MKTFDCIIKEFPQTSTTNTGNIDFTEDILTRHYNRYWGNLTGTTMVKRGDSYEISGSWLSIDSWQQLLYCRTLYTHPHTILPHTLMTLFDKNHLKTDLVQDITGCKIVIMNSCNVDDCPCHTEISIPPRDPYFNSSMGCCSTNPMKCDDF